MKLEQEMTMHLNGGSDWSEMQYRIIADGSQTNIYRLVRTNGRPQYKKTSDVLVCGEESFDVLANGLPAAAVWVEERAPK